MLRHPAYYHQASFKTTQVPFYYSIHTMLLLFLCQPQALILNVLVLRGYYTSRSIFLVNQILGSLRSDILNTFALRVLEQTKNHALEVQTPFILLGAVDGVYHEIIAYSREHKDSVLRLNTHKSYKAVLKGMRDEAQSVELVNFSGEGLLPYKSMVNERLQIIKYEISMEGKMIPQ